MGRFFTHTNTHAVRETRHTLERHTVRQTHKASHRRRPSCSDTLARDFPAAFAPCSACSPRASRALGPSSAAPAGRACTPVGATSGSSDEAPRQHRHFMLPCCRCVSLSSLTHIVYRHTHSMPDVDGCTWTAHRQPLTPLKLETPVGRHALLYHGERGASAAAARATTLGSTKLRQRSASPGAAPSPSKRSSSQAIR